MTQVYTSLSGVRFLKPLTIECNKQFELFMLFNVLPTEYLKVLTSLFKEKNKNREFTAIQELIIDIDVILEKRIDIDSTMNELKTMPSDFILHVNDLIQSMIKFEKKRASTHK
ncbi:hypothetical protein ABER99_20200 [Paenibacillus glucanolyticus]|jgi:hypothetical protein|uniref:Uncharacterized protein n=1 Tax=Paenibacillus glucanolyticus TaxID=59843 RepID=A0A163GL05_9BACL|nr:hypothetical protein [Paenibacillus glucanolyticus]KZS45028.1 hypothetical protein AWU65_03335 [Paenibacillus glucanolyticus]OMF66735.1 hypothetical protein BK142_29380 [Paenibacillus glucanolyticus]